MSNMDWKLSFYYQIRWWHIIWLGAIILILAFGIWNLSNSQVDIRLKQIDPISGGCVARIGLSSKLPFRYTIEPFFTEVWKGDTLFSRFQPFDGTRYITSAKETELLLVFNLEAMAPALEDSLAHDYSIKAVIPLTVLGITKAETFQAGFTYSDNVAQIIR